MLMRTRTINPDPRVAHYSRSGAAVSNDAVWHNPRKPGGHWVINRLDVRLQREPEQLAVVDDFGSLVVVS